MIRFRTTQVPRTMFQYARYAFSLYSATSTSTKISWDPTVSLTLGHPTLVLLEKCRTTEHFKQILAQMMRLHLTSQTFPMSRLLYFSTVSHPESLNYSILLFNHFTPHPNLYIYHIMISALSFSLSQSIDLYKSMLWSCIYPDEHTLLSLLKSAKCLSVGKQVHVHVIVSGFMSHIYLQNSLIKMYVENGKMDLAYQVFQYMPKKDIVSYNIMISGYSVKGCVLEALELFHEAVVSDIKADQFTMVGLLMCCRQLKNAFMGKSVHGWIIRKSSVCGWGLILSNALLDMYAKFGDMKVALKIFDRLVGKDCVSWNIIIAGFANLGEFDVALRFFSEAPSRDLVSWNSVLSGFAQKGDCGMVMKVFAKMLDENIKPDMVTSITLVCASAEMGVLSQGRCTHGWVIKAHGMTPDAFLGSAVVDMYSKCGSMEKALVVFDMITERDITVITAMINGLAFHGHGINALELFWKMQEGGLMPNSVTLVSVLTACSHAGLVDEGYEIFENMNRTYGIEPEVEHYGCVVDLLARSGRLNEAQDVIKRMPMKPSRSIWGALLSGSIGRGNMELAEAASMELLKLEPEEEGGYVLMSNLYAGFGRWTYRDEMRELMGSRGVKKTAGYSSIVVDGVAHSFGSSDKRNMRWDEIYCMLCNLHMEMKSGAEAA